MVTKRKTNCSDLLEGRNPKLTTAADKNTYAGLVLSSFTRYRWFSGYVIAAMLVDENKRSLISSFCSSNQQLYITSLLPTSLEIGCKPPIEHDGSKRNIEEHSKQVYTTQWSGKWEKKLFSLTSEQKIINSRARRTSLSNDITHQNTRFHCPYY